MLLNLMALRVNLWTLPGSKNLGWQYRYNLHEGLSLTYKWFIENINSFRG